MINEGDKAPTITVTATDGSSVNLASPGQPLVLYFYPKDDTSGCTREAQDFTALAGDFKKAGVKVIGLSRDPMKAHEKFIGKYDLAVPLVSEEVFLYRHMPFEVRCQGLETAVGITRTCLLKCCEQSIRYPSHCRDDDDGLCGHLSRDHVNHALKGGDVANGRAAKFHHCWTDIAQFRSPAVSVSFYDRKPNGTSRRRRVSARLRNKSGAEAHGLITE